MVSSDKTGVDRGAQLVEVTCSCGRMSSITRRAFNRVERGGRHYLCRSCVSRKTWTNAEYRDLVLSGSIRSAKAQDKLKQVQRTDAHRRIQSNRSSLAWEDKARRVKASDSSKKLWLETEYRTSQVRKQAERWDEDNYRAEQLRARSDPSYRTTISAATKRALSDPTVVEKMSSLAKKRWEDEGYRKKLGLARATWADGKVSSLEQITFKILSSMGVKVVRQHPIDHYLFDFFIPEKGLLIECQGEYWHSLPKMMGSDAAKFRKVDEYFPDLRIVYLYERDFMNPEMVRRKLASEILGEKGPKSEEKEFAFGSVKIVKVSVGVKEKGSRFSAPESFLRSFHYAGYGRSAKTVYGAFLGEELVAVCKFSTVVRKEVATSMGLEPSAVLELDRFCIHPLYQKKNFASWLLSRFSKTAFSDFPKTELLVAFSDATVGHAGTIYKASNWSKEGMVRPDYHYLSPDGIVVHKKTLYNHAVKMGMKEREYAEAHGYEKRPGKEKTKFSLRRVA